MNQHINYELIDHPDAMVLAIEKLIHCSSLALDMEMENQLHRYGLHIALIQVSTPDQNFIFDPVSGIDLEPLGSIITDPDIELVIHDADFDKRACHLLYQWKLNHIFDTKVAAQLCGFRKPGLATLLDHFLNIQTNKKFQKNNWLKRPLRKEALDYAVKETACLFSLKDLLKKRLIELGRLDWAQEEFSFCEHNIDSKKQLPAHCRIKKSASLSPRQLAVLRSLTVYRDSLARTVNRPVYFIIKDKTLLQMAILPPASLSDIKKVRSLHPMVYSDFHALRLLKAVKNGHSAPEEMHPAWRNHSVINRGYHKRLKAMQKWRANAAAPLDLEPYLLLSNNVLKWCALHMDNSMPSYIDSQIRNWQKTLVWPDFQKEFLVHKLCSEFQNQNNQSILTHKNEDVILPGDNPEICIKKAQEKTNL